ncbi:MAG: hypothetical protein ACI9A7_002084 [Cyclobacteriaceae bacterium]|jgi:hypothetical protein
MKKRIKDKSCLNCYKKLGQDINYCPNCGQENNTIQLSFGQLVTDFFSNYISIDSKFGRTFKPFLIKPGSLTKAFMDGKRVSFANPIRWYLVISLVHFFVLSQVNKNFSDEDQMIIGTGQKSNPGISFSLESDSLQSADNSKPVEKNTISDNDAFNIEAEMILIEQMIENGYKKNKILDSLKLEDKPFWPRQVLKQTVKLYMDDQQSLNSYMLQNVPILMFILLPLYALILKLFFRERLYINHLIHSIYIHSFFFFVMTFYWIVFALFDNEVPKPINMAFFILLFAHNFLSFKNLYEVKVRRAIASLTITGMVYTLFLCVGMVVLILISLLLF